MSFLQKNFAWLMVCVLALFPLIKIFSLISFNFEYPEFDFILFDDIELAEQVALKTGRDIIPGIEIAIEQTGEWAIRWLMAVLMITPFKIVFGTKSNLFVRQAMGISCGVYVFLHAFFFLYHEGFFAVVFGFTFNSFRNFNNNNICTNHYFKSSINEVVEKTLENLASIGLFRYTVDYRSCCSFK